MFYLFIFLFVLLFLFYFIYTNKIRIDIPTFFKKGFRKEYDSYGLYSFCAPQGDGKTFSVVRVMNKFCKHKICITNVKSFYESHKTSSIYMTDLLDIINFIKQSKDPSQYVIFFDELFDALSYGKLTKDTRKFFTQLRKRRLFFFTTVQIWADVPIQLRRLTRFQVTPHMFNFLGLFAVCVNEINDGYNIKWSQVDQEYICPRLKTLIFKANLSTARSYDTYECIETSSNIN